MKRYKKRTVPLNQNERRLLGLQDDFYFASKLSTWDKAVLRSARIARHLGAVIQDDFTRHPWKIPPMIIPMFGLGTTIMVLTTLCYLTSPFQRGCDVRAKIYDAFTGPIMYGLYIDCIEKNNFADYPLKVDTDKLVQTYRTNAMFNLYAMGQGYTNKLPNGLIKKFIGSQLSKRISRGQLVPA